MRKRILTDEEIAEIKCWINEGIPNIEIAHAYLVSSSLIGAIKSGKCHPHIGGPITRPLTPRAKLSMEQARAIRQCYKEGGFTIDQLAYTYNVTPGQISKIITNQTWRE